MAEPLRASAALTTPTKRHEHALIAPHGQDPANRAETLPATTIAATHRSRGHILRLSVPIRDRRVPTPRRPERILRPAAATLRHLALTRRRPLRTPLRAAVPVAAALRVAAVVAAAPRVAVGAVAVLTAVEAVDRMAVVVEAVRTAITNFLEYQIAQARFCSQKRPFFISTSRNRLSPVWLSRIYSFRNSPVF